MVLLRRSIACVIVTGLVLTYPCLAPRWSQGTAAASVAQDAPDLCISAAQIAAERTGVPLPVLLAITLAETGRTTKRGLRPWPWAINQAGQGQWFATSADAVQFAENQLDLGLRNFDVGCFQINHRWHSKGFRSTVDMFDPTSNAIYAAGFLADLYAEKGDWSLAAAAYHSRSPDEAARYQTKFDAIYAGFDIQPSSEYADIAQAPRMNRFPLLRAGSRGKFGSLVPLFSAGPRLIGEQP